MKKYREKCPNKMGRGCFNVVLADPNMRIVKPTASLHTGKVVERHYAIQMQAACVLGRVLDNSW